MYGAAQNAHVLTRIVHVSNRPNFASLERACIDMYRACIDKVQFGVHVFACIDKDGLVRVLNTRVSWREVDTTRLRDRRNT